MHCAVSTSSGVGPRQSTDNVAATDWFAKNTAFAGFSKQWRTTHGSPAQVPSRHAEYPTPTGEGT